MLTITPRRAMSAGLLLALLIGFSSHARSGGAHAPPFYSEGQGSCNPAGTWLGSNDFGEDFVLTWIPLGRGLNRFSIVSEGGPTALFPSFEGDAVRSGHNRYDITQVALVRVDANGLPSQVGTDLVIVVTGFGELSGDCNELELGNLIANAYLLGLQDPFGDDPPVVSFGPAGASYRRVPVIEQPD